MLTFELIQQTNIQQNEKTLLIVRFSPTWVIFNFSKLVHFFLRLINIAATEKSPFFTSHKS